MTNKSCNKCNSPLGVSDVFCGNCGSKYQEPIIQPPPTQVNQNISSSSVSASIQSESGVVSFSFNWKKLYQNLLGTSTYSVERAKWLYQISEKIFNTLTIIGLIVITIYVLFMLLPLLRVPELFFSQLGVDVMLFGIFLIWLIFSKLLFIGIGSVIHIAEMSDKK